MIPKYYKCGDPTGRCERCLTGKLVNGKQWICASDNPSCLEFREEATLAEVITEFNLGRYAVGLVALVIFLMLLLSLGQCSRHGKAIDGVAADVDRLDERLSQLEAMPKPKGPPGGFAKTLEEARRNISALKGDTDKAIAEKNAEQVPSLRQRLSALQVSIQNLRQSRGGLNAGSASLKAEATQLLNSYRELEGVVESLQDQVDSSDSPESERVVQLSDGIRRSKGRAQKLLASNTPGKSEGKGELETGELEKLPVILAQVGKSLDALVPTPFPPSSATMRIAAPSDLAESLLVPLLNSWAGSDAVLSGGGDYYLDAQTRGEKIVVESLDAEAGRQALADGTIDLLVSDIPGGGDAELSRSRAEVIALNAVTLLVHPDNPLKVLKSDLDNSGFVLGSDPAIQRNAKRFGLNASDKTDRTPLDEALHNRDRIVLSLYSLDGTGLKAKRLAVQPSPNVPELKPSPFSIATEDYAYSFRIIAANPPDLKSAVTEFVQFMTSDDGQAIVEKQGYVDLRLRQGDVNPAILAVLGEVSGVGNVHSATRISTNLRFATGKADLDLKAIADMERIPKYIAREFPTHKVVILGFTDNTGPRELHGPLSQRRADEIAAELRKSKVDSNSKGLGMDFPVDSNDTEAGHAKNRRAEVWVVKP